MDRTTSHLWPRPGFRPDRTKIDIQHDGEMMATDDQLLLFLWWRCCCCCCCFGCRSRAWVSRRRHVRQPVFMSDVRTNPNCDYVATFCQYRTIAVTERCSRYIDVCTVYMQYTGTSTKSNEFSCQTSRGGETRLNHLFRVSTAVRRSIAQLSGTYQSDVRLLYTHHAKLAFSCDYHSLYCDKRLTHALLLVAVLNIYMCWQKIDQSQTIWISGL